MFADHQVSKASAYVDCYAKAIAEVWAFALAKAAAEAQCWPGQDAKASADIIAKVGVHIQFQEKCVVDIYESGLADGSVGDSGTFTGAVRLPSAPAAGLLCCVMDCLVARGASPHRAGLNKKQIGHHARPRRALIPSATSLLLPCCFFMFIHGFAWDSVPCET